MQKHLDAAVDQINNRFGGEVIADKWPQADS